MSRIENTVSISAEYLNYLKIKNNFKNLQKCIDKTQGRSYYNINNRNELLTQIKEVYSRETREEG